MINDPDKANPNYGIDELAEVRDVPEEDLDGYFEPLSIIAKEKRQGLRKITCLSLSPKSREWI